MLDKSLPYFKIIMKRKAGTPVPEAPLREGFRFVPFQKGDEAAWADIETSVLEFDHAAAAEAYFKKRFLGCFDEVERRTFFIADAQGRKVATLTPWWNYTGVRRHPFMHWVAVKPECQGLGLGKAIIAEGLRRMIAIEGDCDMYLSTQTWSHKAIRLYLWAGFDFETEEPNPGGYNNQTRQGLEIIRGLLGR
jgi:GNAT superfamily N-acetyltransferase